MIEGFLFSTWIILCIFGDWSILYYEEKLVCRSGWMKWPLFSIRGTKLLSSLIYALKSIVRKNRKNDFSTSICLLMVIWIRERKISILAVYFDWNVNLIFFPILNVKTMVLLLIFEEEDRNALYSSEKLQILIFFLLTRTVKNEENIASFSLLLKLYSYYFVVFQ